MEVCNLYMEAFKVSECCRGVRVSKYVIVVYPFNNTSIKHAFHTLQSSTYSSLARSIIGSLHLQYVTAVLTYETRTASRLSPLAAECIYIHDAFLTAMKVG
jgi:hypothetical protein